VFLRGCTSIQLYDHSKLPQTLRLTTNWTYIRFHYGSGADGDYTVADLDRWADRIRDFRRQGAGVWAYFNTDWQG
jgi:uncharacterized protein YecE (DUF72 family)